MAPTSRAKRKVTRKAMCRLATDYRGMWYNANFEGGVCMGQNNLIGRKQESIGVFVGKWVKFQIGLVGLKNYLVVAHTLNTTATGKPVHLLLPN